MVLMPLMDETQCKAYLERVAKKLFDEHKIELNNVTEEARMKQIKKSDNRDSCLAFVNQIVGVKKEDPAPKKRRWLRRVA